MAFPTAVNSQITDAVTQSNVKVLGDAPAQAMGNLFMVLSQAAGIAAQNAVTNQQDGNTLADAVLTRCVASLLESEDKK
jgi:hypothetical protein